MYPRLIQPRESIVTQEDIQAAATAAGGSGASDQHDCLRTGESSLAPTSCPKPRLRWTADLHERFLDAVSQLGGASKATPKAIMRTMGVNGLTLFHLKSHLQKYRLGKQSGNEMSDSTKDGISASYLLDSPHARNSSQSMPTSDQNEGYEVKEALTVQMDGQSKLHLQVEAEKHVQIREDAEQRYMAILERACKMLVDQIIGSAVTEAGAQNCEEVAAMNLPSSSQSPLKLNLLQSDRVLVHCAEDVSSRIHQDRADCSTESCLTSHEPPEGFPSGGRKRMLNMDLTNMDLTTSPLIWCESEMRTADVPVVQLKTPMKSLSGRSRDIRVVF